MPESSWSPDAAGDQPASEPLQAALAEQCGRIRELLVLASRHAAEDPAHVHQLRVATRRAEAIVEAADGFLGEKRRQRLVKGLRRLRQLASDARDLDVALEQLVAFPPASLTVELRWRLVHATAVERGLAQQELSAGIARVRRKRRVQDWQDSAARLAWRGEGDEPTWDELASHRLQLVVHELATAGDPWPATTRTLHALRIAVKQGRYACELFASALPGFAEARSTFQCLQDELGAWHDLRVRTALWKTWLDMPWAPNVQDELREQIASWQEQEPAVRQALADRWSRTAFTALLGQLSGATESDDADSLREIGGLNDRLENERGDGDEADAPEDVTDDDVTEDGESQETT